MNKHDLSRYFGLTSRRVRVYKTLETLERHDLSRDCGVTWHRVRVYKILSCVWIKPLIISQETLKCHDEGYLYKRHDIHVTCIHDTFLLAFPINKHDLSRDFGVTSRRVLIYKTLVYKLLVYKTGAFMSFQSLLYTSTKSFVYFDRKNPFCNGLDTCLQNICIQVRVSLSHYLCQREKERDTERGRKRGRETQREKERERQRGRETSWDNETGRKRGRETKKKSLFPSSFFSHIICHETAE